MNGKDISHSSGQSGTTGLFSTKRKKKNAVYIKNIYMIRECIYKGQFHNTYKGVNKNTKQPVMIKMTNQYHEHINNENKVIKMLKDVSFTPKVLHTGEEKINGSTYFVKVTESFGPSIKILHSLMGNSLSLSTICIFAINMLNVLEEIHKFNIVHRNVKPRKIVINNDLKNTSLYLLDFKYARKYKHKNGQLVRYNENSRVMNKVFCNKFSSIGTHLGNMLGNKHFKSREEKLKYYEEWKLSFIPETLNSEMPQEFINYLNYIKSMNILDPPEYDVWRKQFKILLQKIGVTSQNDYVYEWIPKIKNDMVNQFGNSFLQDLDTPLTMNHQKENSKYSQVESEDKVKEATSSNNANPEETTANQTNNQKQQTETTIASAQPVLSAHVQEQSQNIQNNIQMDTESFGAGGINYYYGPIEIDMNEINGKNANSNITFGADSEHRNQFTNNTNNTNKDNNNNNPNNGSILDNFSIYNKKSQIHSSQHLNTSQHNHINTSNYSTDDLSICDDETQNSLSSQLSRHNSILMQVPFFFKFKPLD